MKIVWGIYEGLCDYDGDARSTEFFVSREDAEQAVKTLIRKRVASNVYPMCCEVQKYILFESRLEVGRL